MGDQPLCPIVLSLLASGPRRPHEVARVLPFGYPAALVALERLRSAGLVRQRSGVAYAITRRGRSELALQRGLWALVASARAGGTARPGH
jgi:predicted transcriptional regulator